MNLATAEQLRIASDGSTPAVLLNNSGYLSFEGRSMNPKAVEFSSRVEEWIDNYVQDPAEITIVDFHFEYLGTSNIRMYVQFLDKLLRVTRNGHKVRVNWFYDEDDIDIFEKGENISLALGIQLSYHMKK